MTDPMIPDLAGKAMGGQTSSSVAANATQNTYAACFHVWHLIEELPARWKMVSDPNEMTIAPDFPAVRRWYCDRCRLVEETTA